MIKLAGIAGMALGLVLGVSALGIASAQDGTTTPSTGVGGSPTTSAGGGTTTPGASGTATPASTDDPLDVGTPATSDGSGGVGGDTKAPASGTGTFVGGDNDVRTGLFFVALSVMAAGAAALVLGMQRRPTS